MGEDGFRFEVWSLYATSTSLELSPKLECVLSKNYSVTRNWLKFLFILILG